MSKKSLILLLLACCSLSAFPQTEGGKSHAVIDWFRHWARIYNNYDTTYVEPDRYHMTAMLHTIEGNEWYTLRSRSSQQSLTFASHPSLRVGPHIGWHFLLLGYNLDVLNLGKERVKKREMEISIYTNRFGADFFHRKTGSDFSLHSSRGYAHALDPFEGTRTDAIQSSLIGLNLYFIANHRHFSLPAAHRLLTRQRRSAGTWKYGISITQHDVHIDHCKLNTLIPGATTAATLKPGTPAPGTLKPVPTTGIQAERVKYMDFGVSGGYAYNWVPRQGWLLSFDLAPSVGYRRADRSVWSDAAMPEGTSPFKKGLYYRGNFNADMTARIGMVWNNTRNYVGISLVAHTFNYRQHDLTSNDTFITCKFYTGINFWKR